MDKMELAQTNVQAAALVSAEDKPYVTVEDQNTAISSMLKSAESAISLIRTFVDKPYYEILENLAIRPCRPVDAEAVADAAWLYRISRLAYEKDKRDFGRKLGNVISAVGMCGGTLVMRIDYKVPEINIQIGVLDRQRKTGITTLKDTLYSSFKGNFSGSELEDVGYDELCGIIKDCTENSFSYNCVTAISNMAQQEDGDKPLSGLENILNASGDKPFSMLVLGEPMDKQEMAQIKKLYEDLSTQLSKFIHISFSQQQGSSVAKGENSSVSENHSFAKNINFSVGNSKNSGESKGSVERENPNKRSPVFDTIYAAGAALSALNGNMMGIWAMNALRDVVKEKPDTWNDKNVGISNTVTDTKQRGGGESETKGKTTQTGTSHTYTTNEGFSAQYTLVNHSAKGLYDSIVKYLEWFRKNENYGMFNVCAYVLSSSASTNMTVASQYASMMNGEHFARTYGINTWIGAEGKKIRQYLAGFRHPEFVHPSLGEVTSSVAVSGTELAQNFLLPQKSVGNLSVLHYEPFGRNVVCRQEIGINGNLLVGCIHHIGCDIEREQVPINVDSLSRHSFIGGANGTGKSTAIFTLLHKIYKRGIPFMVIEPAKGEYKRVLGGLKNVSVYSPMHLEGLKLLRLNLFWFRGGIDVNEHVEKLVELFCSCWPMYAAMPQVLRNAIFNAYESCGWDLEHSENPFGNIYPNISDVCTEIEKVIKASAFSAEVQGNYIGSLFTRMQSLDKGIYKRIFSSGDIGDEQLFEQNVILDISRPDASDVKALIMGLLIIRHFEYCASDKTFGDSLKHLTVLEEAHTLLAAKPASSEGADIGNKSIEMMSRCIAELGGFGQGFIIADQAPALLDRSVIRNTNTKMIFRLPDMADCELTGRAIGLTDAQYSELSRLSRGVCAVHQINWEEAVLCHIRPDLPWEEPKNEACAFEEPECPAMTDYLTCLLTPFSVIGKKTEAADKYRGKAQEWALGTTYCAKDRLTLLKAIHPEFGENWRMVIEAIQVLAIKPYGGNRSDLAAWTECAVEKAKEYIEGRMLALTLIEAVLDNEWRTEGISSDFHDTWFDFVKEERSGG